ncbi:cryptochrome/photolyase family protein [Noviherbaspirillum autotrophicum]|uniref:Deoxyribodipyrimidine photo-lyase n=1 Tax=Noviherbaspirillum autotrophicum TaxID=709839 RepID=A0A0C1Y8B3_9BURK|nr:deoxyribodipyrimidine photo-lyase [Noviherbaspirillum autotrophicum]KIF83158.1 deoxyribodipyrimidine photolyase [Noviherbaspirillum autotrophicum]
MPQYDKSLVWFRRDLRVLDHAALYQALAGSRQVFCVFVFDKDILNLLPRQDRRVEFIHACATELDVELRKFGGGLIVRHASAAQEIPALAAALGVNAVFANRDYEPQAIERDLAVATRLKADGRAFVDFKDQVIFEKDEVTSQSGKPYSVFTPYKNAWLKKLALLADSGSDSPLHSYFIDSFGARLAPCGAAAMPSLSELGFEKTNLESLHIPTGISGARKLLDDFLSRIDAYDVTRDYPSLKGPSYLSTHLRFGTISIRYLVKFAYDIVRMKNSPGASVWLSELIWRDFYFMILHAHPYVAERAFKPAYDQICWESGAAAEKLFAAWCEGKTGYPLVDAAMAQLNTTGYMHNRLRMIAACFLIKDLGIDWRWGERYFSEKLNDFDMAANNGGWQWAASSGCDAQPYFRIFNPVTQSIKFDPEGKFIRRYLPQLGKLSNKTIHAPWLAPSSELRAAGIELGNDYPAPLVLHEAARERTLARYAVVKAAS